MAVPHHMMDANPKCTYEISKTSIVNDLSRLINSNQHSSKEHTTIETKIAAGKNIVLHSKKHFCVHCNKSFVCKNELVKHRAQHYRKNCDVCNKSFKCKVTVEKHKASVHVAPDEIKYVSCEYCGKLVKPVYLELHKKRYHQEQNEAFKCDLCGKNFKYKCVLKSHISSVHSNETDQIRCELCNKVYKHKISLYSHIKLVHTDKPNEYVCDICGRKVKSMYSHMKYVHNQIKYSCDLCNKEYSSLHGMLSHKKSSHTDERKWTCDVCGHSFKAKLILQKHFVTHNEARNYKCDLCEKTFKYKMVLKTHQRVHSGLQPYTCDNCGQSFKWKQTFSKHFSKCNLVS